MSAIGFQSSFQIPAREIPSMQTNDLLGARPRQATLNRDVWQNEYVKQSIQNQPKHKERQENLGLKIKNPMYSDFYYKKVDLNNPTVNKAPPEIIVGNKHQLLQQSLIRPSQQHNDSLQDFMKQNAVSAKKFDQTNIPRLQQSVQQYEKSYGGNKSGLVMHVDPGKTNVRSQPFANFSGEQIDDAKYILRNDAHLSDNNQHRMTISKQQRFINKNSQSVQDRYQTQTSRNANNYNSQNGLYGTQQQQNKFLSPSASISNLYGTQGLNTSQPNINLANNNGSMMQNNSTVSLNQSMVQPQSNQNQQFQGQIQSRGNQVASRRSQQNQQQQREQVPIHSNLPILTQNQNQDQNQNNNNKNYYSQQYSQTPQHKPVSNSIANQQYNQQNQGGMSASIIGKKTYKPYNVVTHKRHQQYEPKYEVPNNHWDCYDKPKWQDYVAKKEAPTNIFKEKNKNNIPTQDFSTSAMEYGVLKNKYQI